MLVMVIISGITALIALIASIIMDGKGMASFKTAQSVAVLAGLVGIFFAILL